MYKRESKIPFAVYAYATSVLARGRRGRVTRDEAEECGDGVAPVDVVDVARPVRVGAGGAAERLDLDAREQPLGIAPREPVLDAEALVDVL